MTSIVHARRVNLGRWNSSGAPGGASARAGVRFGEAALRDALGELSTPLALVEVDGVLGVAPPGQARFGADDGDGWPLVGFTPALTPDDLGDPAFRAAHGLRYAYVAGAMANGITSVALVEAMARGGCIGFFGAAGLALEEVEAAVARLGADLGDLPFGANLIHSPDEPELEAAVAALYLRREVRRVSASAYLDLTLPIVRYRTHGIHTTPDGQVVAPNHVFAKVSRVEVARRFLEPPPASMLAALVEAGELTPAQARMAATLPMAGEITAEADSGGHTDNRPLVVLLPSLQSLRDEVSAIHGYTTRPRVGAAGGIGTPAAAAMAFSLGAAYVLTGSINQACQEAGTSDAVREMLAAAQTTDVAMAPAADMFEMGVKVQVLSRGTLFAARARKLYDLYRAHERLEDLPPAARAELERVYFKAPLDEAWASCAAFWQGRDPAQLERADADPHHKMALLFRAYLGLSSRWANAGVPDRRADYQVWCGPALGAFNAWTAGTTLATPAGRDVLTVAQNLLYGAAIHTRLAALRAQGAPLYPALAHQPPVGREEIRRRFQGFERPAPVNAPVNTPAEEGAKGRWEEPIAIVGLGAIFPKALGVKAFWRLLHTGMDAVGEVPATHWSLADYHDPDPKTPDHTYGTRGAFLRPVDFDPTEFGIPPNILEATDTSQLLGLLAARMALEDAGYGEGVPFDRSRVSVILGVTGTQELVISLGSRLGHPHWRRGLLEAGIDAAKADEVVERIGRSWVEWQENSFPGLLGNVVAGRIANRLDLGGTNCVVDAACASSLGAVHLACLELLAGRSDMVLSGGVDALNDIFMHMCFSKTPALSPTGDARPFDVDADGTVLGEGVGLVVLKRLSRAAADGDRIYAVIRGLGTSSDGRAKSIYAPLPEGQAKALVAAREDAGVSARSITLVEAHGTGTKAGDVCEAQGLKLAFGEAADAPWCALGSVKSQIGHTKAAAGAAGLMKVALALHRRVLPPTCKVKAPNPALGLDGSPFYVSTVARPWLAPDGGPRRAGVSAFGFGGSNFHAIVEEYGPGRRAPAWDGAVEILALSGASAGEVLAGLEAVAALPDGPAQLAALARARGAFDPRAAHRLVMVLGVGEEGELGLAGRIDRVRGRLGGAPGEAFEAPEGTFYGVGAAAGPVSFLFPGQGAQRVGMLSILARVFPEALDALHAAGDVAHLVYPPPAWDEASRAAQEARLTDTRAAQPALGAVCAGAVAVLERFGVHPTSAAGHSYGELTALYAAGALDRAGLMALSAERGRLMAEGDGGRGAMLAVLAPRAAAEALIEASDGALVLANLNAPHQTVLAGPREAIDAAAARAAERGIEARRLPVGAAFHSPLVAPAELGLRRALAAHPLSPPTLPVLSDTTAAPYPQDPEAMADLLARQLASPVRFVEVVEALWERGARTFVEVGPGRILTGLVQAILSGRPGLHTLPLDNNRDDLSGLATLLARLAALGHPVHLDAWEADAPPPRAAAHPPRRPRMNVPLTGANHRAPDTRPPVPSAPAPRPRVDAPPPAAPAQRRPEPAPIAHPPHSAQEVVPVPTSPPPRPTSTPAAALEALRLGQQHLAALQSLQGQTAQLHQAFLEGQSKAHEGFAQLIEGQQRLIARLIDGGAEATLPAEAPAATAPAPRAPAAPPPPRLAPVVATPAPATPPAALAPVGHDVARPLPSTAVPPPPRGDSWRAGLGDTLLGVVSTATGYPPDMLTLDMDIEAELGIDSIKRVEILSILSSRVPEAPRVDAKQLGKLRTLKEVRDLLIRDEGAPAEVAAPTPRPGPHAEAGRTPLAREGARDLLLGIVAERTGYPLDMLDLGMDLEADLGIDSIKRVEILSIVTERLPGAQVVDAKQLGKLRTVGQVLDVLMANVAGGAAPPAAATNAPVGPPSPAAGRVTAAAASTTPAVASTGPAARTRRPLERWGVEAVGLPAGAPARGALPFAPGLEVWIGGGNTGLADALGRSLTAEGHLVRRVEPTLDLPAETPVGALILVGDPALTPDGDPAAADAAVKGAFTLLQRAAAGLRRAPGGGHLVVIPRMDGALGVGAESWDDVSDAVSGALAGLARTAAREWPELHTRVLDVDAHLSPSVAAPLLLAELRRGTPAEVGLGLKTRRALKLSPRPIQSRRTLDRGELVVVSGGARGVTAACAVALAEATGAALLLLGRSPAPEAEPAWLAAADDERAVKAALLQHGFPGRRPTPREVGEATERALGARAIQETLDAISAAGSPVMYRTVDVRDPAAVEAALSEARAAFGPVRGVLHGAGVLRDKRIEEKTAEQLDLVWGTKVDGLRALLRATTDDDLRFFVGFSSVSGRFGRRGQIDYAMANQAQDTLLRREATRRPACRVVSIAWGPWAGGMVDEGLANVFEKEGVGLIPLVEGARHLVAEALAEPTEPSVVVVACGLGPWQADEEPAPPQRDAPPPTGANVNLAQRGAVALLPSPARVATWRISANDSPWLWDHSLAHRPVVPVAVLCDLLLAAAGDGPAHLEDVRLLKGVGLEAGALTLEAWEGPADGEAGTPMELRDDAGRARIRARVRTLPPDPPGVPAPAGPLMDWTAPRGALYGGDLFHGPSFQVIRRIDGTHEAGMRLVIVADEARTWIADRDRAEVLLLDACLQALIVWSWAHRGAACLPDGMASWTVWRRPERGEEIRAEVWITHTEGQRIEADVTLVDGAEQVVASLLGATATWSEGLEAAFFPPAAAAER